MSIEDKKITAKDIADFLKKESSKNQALSVDLRFTDMIGKEQHVSVPAYIVDENFIKGGKMFDGSSIAGWAEIDKSDMVLKPILEMPIYDTVFSDTLNPTDEGAHNYYIMRCNVYDLDGNGYSRDPRTIALKAEKYLKDSGIADYVLCGPELEFFLFDDVRFKTSMHGSEYHIDDIEGAWNTNTKYEEGNKGYRPAVKGGYFPVAPVDSSVRIRNEMCYNLTKMGLEIEAHHHEVATAGQNEIATKFNFLTKKADEVQIYKYVVHNVAHQFDKTATFMPKPLFGDNGSGMHVHFSLGKDGKNLFIGDGYSGLSEEALYFIGGILKHSRALNAFTNPSTNSYKRLVPGFEAPILLAYSAANRTASIRIPYITNPKGTRIEVRYPDGTANPYLCFTALLMAGLDGIKNKIHPGDPMDKNLYKLTGEELQQIPQVCYSLDEALKALEEDYEFLLEGDVFSKEFLDAYIKLKNKEVQKVRMIPHPAEFEMYYSC